MNHLIIFIKFLKERFEINVKIRDVERRFTLSYTPLNKKISIIDYKGFSLYNKAINESFINIDFD